VAAIVVGLIDDRSAGTSRTALVVGAAQWIGHGFKAMAVATALAIVLTAARWPWQQYGRRGGGSAASGTGPSGHGQAGRRSSQQPRPRPPARLPARAGQPSGTRHR